MTQDEFSANPIIAAVRITNSGQQVSPEWVSAAWNQSPAFRDYILDLAIRSVEKTGSLGLALEWVQLLPDALSAAQTSDFYLSVKEGTGRSETEWRSEFELLFPKHSSALPPIDLQRVINNLLQELLFYIGLKRVEKVRELIGRLVTNRWNLAK